MKRFLPFLVILSSCSSGPTVIEKPDGTAHIIGSQDWLNKVDYVEYTVERPTTKITYKRHHTDNTPVVQAWGAAKVAGALGDAASEGWDVLDDAVNQ